MEAAPVPGRRELSKQARRQAIVDAARRSFLDEGYAGTSMSALLKTLGGSKETLWGYFRSKEDLFAAVIAEISATFRAGVETALTSGSDLEAGLLHFCRSFIERVESPPALATWRLIAAESGRFPEVGRIFYENAARHTEAVLGGFLAEHVAQGRLRDEDPFVMARTLISLCVGRQTRLLWGVETADVDHPDADAARYTDIFLRAYRP
jgi:TetR/AcrR family transcriptional repressor of mexJK operon